MSTDTLTASSRAFFERTKAKLAASIVLAASALLLLGFCATAGGNSAANDQMQQYYDKNNDDHMQTSYKDLAAGYGFASFAYILAFFLLLFAAVYVSPLFCGSNNEKKMIRSPLEIDSLSYAAYSESPAASQV